MIQSDTWQPLNGKQPQPAEQYLAPEAVLEALGHEARRRIRDASLAQIAVLALLGGAFIAFGALFSVILSTGVDAYGPKLLLQGLGFSAGFFFVILSHAVLFTEVNVMVPARLLALSPASHCARIGLFWGLAALGNLAGAILVGWLVHLTQAYPAEQMEVLRHVVDKKMRYAEAGTAGAWFAALGSGVMGNWLVGMAAFFATMGRTIIGKFVPVFLAVTLFVAANFQHSPANAGYFALLMPSGQGPGWGVALSWNLVPAALGNMLGAALLVALPLWYGLRRHPGGFPEIGDDCNDDCGGDNLGE
ncbi:MAG: formate/nitrite transporter family protein [Wenzhouxiangellaceae bacterium]|nr:formate/nitrite transporter family protein [Wenzhouxiangellaceae bacterium]